MTIEELKKIPFHFVSHIALKTEHICNYVSEDGNIAFSVITPVLKNGDTGNPRRHWRIGTKWYKSTEKFLEALEKVPAMVEGNEKGKETKEVKR